MEVGIKGGDRKYVCILDNDSIFLNEWFPVILEKEYAEKGKVYLAKAAEYFETALDLKPNDRNSIIQLKQIYFKLGKRDLADKYREMLDNLGEEKNEGIK